MNKNPAISFGDSVRILASPETDAVGLAGMVGPVFGETVPSSSGVTDVIGGIDGDYAINVHIPGRDQIWLHPRLLEFIDHSPGMEIQIGDHRAVRAESGAWVAPEAALLRKPWWKFW